MWQKITAGAALLFVLFVGIGLGNYKSDMDNAAQIEGLRNDVRNLRAEVRQVNREKTDALKDQRLTLAQEKTDELNRLYALCRSAAVDAGRAAQTTKGVIEAAERVMKAQDAKDTDRKDNTDKGGRK